jgi:hypothetical protein
MALRIIMALLLRKFPLTLDLRVVQDLLMARNQALYEMINQATTRAERGPTPATAPLLRVDLGEDAITGSIDAMATIADGVEEEA